MAKKLNKVNDFLNNLPVPVPEKENEVVLSGTDTVKNILLNETTKLARLEKVSNELLNYLTDSRTIKKLSYKEKQNLFRMISETQINSRDFIVKMAELSSKNAFLQKILETSMQPKEIVTSHNGETYVSNLDEESRKNLTELLRTIAIERIYNS